MTPVEYNAIHQLMSRYAYGLDEHQFDVRQECFAPDAAFENRCSHRSEPLHQGRIRHGYRYCPHYGERFDVLTGTSQSAPAT